MAKEKVIVTEDILKDNPELVEQEVKVGDEIELGEDANNEEIIAALSAELADKNAEIESLKSNLVKKDEEIKKLKSKSKNAKAETAEEKFVNTDGKVIVHFGVQVNGQEYTVADILADKDIQAYLIEIGSGAIEVVEG